MRTVSVLFVILALSSKCSADDSVFSDLMDSIVGDVASAVDDATADLMSRHLYADNTDEENAAEEVDIAEDTSNNVVDTNTAAEEDNIDSTTVKNDVTSKKDTDVHAVSVSTTSVPVTTVTSSKNNTSNATAVTDSPITNAPLTVTPDKDTNTTGTSTEVNMDIVTETSTVTNVTDTNVTEKSSTLEVTTNAVTTPNDIPDVKNVTVTKPNTIIHQNILIDGPVPRTPKNIIKIPTTEKAVTDFKAVTDNPVNNDTSFDINKAKAEFTTPKGIDDKINDIKNKVTDVKNKVNNVTKPIRKLHQNVLIDRPVPRTPRTVIKKTTTQKAVTGFKAVTDNPVNNDITIDINKDIAVTTTPKGIDNEVTTAQSVTNNNTVTDNPGITTSNVVTDTVVTTTPNAKAAEQTTVNTNAYTKAPLDNETTTNKITDENNVTVTTDNPAVATTTKNNEATTLSDNFNDFKSTTIATTLDNAVTTSEFDHNDVPITTNSTIIATTAKNPDTLNSDKATPKVNQNNTAVTTDSAIISTTATNQETAVSGTDNIPKNAKIYEDNIAVTTDSTILTTTAKNEDATTLSSNINDFKSTTIVTTLDNAVTTSKFDNNDIPSTTDSTVATTTAKNREITVSGLNDIVKVPKTDQDKIEVTTDNTVTTTGKNEETITATLDNTVTSSSVDKNDVIVTTESTFVTTTAGNEETRAATLYTDQNKLANTTDKAIVTNTTKNKDATTSSSSINDFKSTTIASAWDNDVTTAKSDRDNVPTNTDSKFVTTTNETTTAATLVPTTPEIDQDKIAASTESTLVKSTAKNQETTTSNDNITNNIEITTTAPVDNNVKISKVDKNNIAITTAAYTSVVTTPVATQDETTNMAPLEQHITTITTNNESFTTPTPTVSEKDAVLDKSYTENTTSNPNKIDLTTNKSTSDFDSTTVVNTDHLPSKDESTDQNTASVTTSGPDDLNIPKLDATNTRRMFIDSAALDKFKSDSTTPSNTNVTTTLATVPVESQEATTIRFDSTTIVVPKDDSTTIGPTVLSASVFNSQFDHDSDTKEKDLPTTAQQINKFDTSTQYITSTSASDVYMSHPTIGLENINPTTDSTTTDYPTTLTEEEQNQIRKLFGNIIPIVTTTQTIPTTHDDSITKPLPTTNSIPPLFRFGDEFNGEPATIIERDHRNQPVMIPISNNIFELPNPNPTVEPILTTVDHEIDSTKRYNPKILLGRDLSVPTTPSTITTEAQLSTTQKQPKDYNLNIVIKYKPKRINDNKV